MMFCDLGKPHLHLELPALQLTLAKACHPRTLSKAIQGGFKLPLDANQVLTSLLNVLDSVIDIR